MPCQACSRDDNDVQCRETGQTKVVVAATVREVVELVVDTNDGAQEAAELVN